MVATDDLVICSWYLRLNVMLTWSACAVSCLTNVHLGDAADLEAGEAHHRALGEPLRVGEIEPEFVRALEDASVGSHHEEESDQHHGREDEEDSKPQIAPGMDM